MTVVHHHPEVPREVQRLTDELLQAHLRAEAAIGIVSLFDEVVEVDADRAVVLDDVVACWLALPPAIQERYARMSSEISTALVCFGSEYIEAVDRDLARTLPESATLRGDEYERLMYQHWQRHVAEARRRHQADEPPSRDWLERFPLTEELPERDCPPAPRRADATEIVW